MEIVKRYERGEGSYESLANEVGVDRGTIRKWFAHYKILELLPLMRISKQILYERI